MSTSQNQEKSVLRQLVEHAASQPGGVNAWAAESIRKAAADQGDAALVDLAQAAHRLVEATLVGATDRKIVEAMNAAMQCEIRTRLSPAGVDIGLAVLSADGSEGWEILRVTFDNEQA